MLHTAKDTALRWKFSMNSDGARGKILVASPVEGYGETPYAHARVRPAAPASPQILRFR